jgi:uncharacterized membrane protein
MHGHDPLVDASSEVIGGPLGRHARVGPPYRTWWLPIRVLLLVVLIASLMSFLKFQSCRANDWQSPAMYVHACYSDIPTLYSSRGLEEHRLPYREYQDQGAIAQPPLANAVIYATSWLVPTGTAPERRRTYFDLNALLLVIALAVTTLVVARLAHGWRDALFVAIAPAGILSLFVAWDGLAAMLTVLALALFQRGSPRLGGAILAGAMSITFYPVVVIGALYLTAYRRKRFHNVDAMAISALAVWLVIHLLVVLISIGGATAFFGEYLNNQVGFGSIWFAIEVFFGVTLGGLNLLWLGSLLVLGALLVIAIRRRGLRPTYAESALILGALYFFVVKSYGPQNVVWLIAIAALCSIRWRDLLIWQSGEVMYHLALWQYLASTNGTDRGLPVEVYAWAIVIRLLALGYLFFVLFRKVEREPRPVLPASEVATQL